LSGTFVYYFPNTVDLNLAVSKWWNSWSEGCCIFSIGSNSKGKIFDI